MRSHLKSLAISLMLSFAACDEPEVHQVCDCSGETLDIYENTNGVVALTREGFKIITVENGILNPCSDLPEDLQVDGTTVSFSAQGIPTCVKDFSGYAVMGTKVIDISSIHTATGLYESGTITIKIIAVGDGFGYEVEDKDKNFLIIQDEIPAVGGTDPFETEADARKVAFLVAHKLKTINDFPSIYLGELFLLRIIHKQD